MKKSALIPLAGLVLLGFSGVAYLVADVYDKVPGILTLRPPYELVGEDVTGNSPVSGKTFTVKGLDLQADKPDTEKVTQALKQFQIDANDFDNTRVAVDPDGEQVKVGAENSSGHLPARVGAIVIDTATGEILAEKNSHTLMTPASSSKVVSALTALDNLGAEYRIPTEVYLADNKLYLRGYGDQYLNPGDGSANLVDGQGNLGELAAQVQHSLKEKGISSVELYLDDLQFGTQKLLPTWIKDETTDYQSVTAPLAVRGGLAAPPQNVGFVADPAAAALNVFANRLEEQGIKIQVSGREKTRGGAEKIAQVYSAPLYETMRDTLVYSDNMQAEVMCRISAIKKGKTGEFSDDVAVAAETLNKLHLPTEEYRNEDCSGLSSNNRITPYLLAQVLQKATEKGQDQLRPLLSALPMGALNGTLNSRFFNEAASGKVWAKTGSLAQARSLSGFLETKSGRTLTFSFIVDSFAPQDGEQAKMAINNLVNTLVKL